MELYRILSIMTEHAITRLGDTARRASDWQRGTYYDSGGFDMSALYENDDGERLYVYWSHASQEAYS